MIGCIGYGFVGSALSNCLSKVTKVIVHDVLDVSNKLEENMEYEGNFQKFIKRIESGNESIYFICVPTPMNLKTQKSQ